MESPLSFHHKRRRQVGKPLWIRFGLWGLGSRKSVEAFLVFCLLMTVGLMCFRLWAFAAGTLLAAFWYWMVLKWTDDNDGWE